MASLIWPRVKSQIFFHEIQLENKFKLHFKKALTLVWKSRPGVYPGGQSNVKMGSQKCSTVKSENPYLDLW